MFYAFNICFWDVHSWSSGKPLFTHVGAASMLHRQDVCLNCKLLYFNFIRPEMISNFWYKTFTISYLQGWPMIYWLGNACSKISWLFQAFQTCLETHDFSPRTCPVETPAMPFSRHEVPLNVSRACQVFSPQLILPQVIRQGLQMKAVREPEA